MTHPSSSCKHLVASRRAIGIVGGGLAGLSVAYHLIKMTASQSLRMKISVIDEKVLADSSYHGDMATFVRKIISQFPFFAHSLLIPIFPASRTRWCFGKHGWSFTQFGAPRERQDLDGRLEPLI
jgi:hypothetical protein